jgi:hypothetical protein
MPPNLSALDIRLLSTTSLVYVAAVGFAQWTIEERNFLYRA